MWTVPVKKAKKLNESTKFSKGILYTIASEIGQVFRQANVFIFPMFSWDTGIQMR